MQSAVLLLALVSTASAYLSCMSDVNSYYTSYYNQYNAREVQCYAGTTFCYMKTNNISSNSYLRNAGCDNTGLSAYCTRSGCYSTGLGATICCCRDNDCNQPSTYYNSSYETTTVKSPTIDNPKSLYCMFDANSCSYYQNYNAREVQCYLGNNFCYMKTANLSSNSYLRNTGCDYLGYCARSGCYSTGLGTSICCCQNRDCNTPSYNYNYEPIATTPGAGAPLSILMPLLLFGLPNFLLQ